MSAVVIILPPSKSEQPANDSMTAQIMKQLVTVRALKNGRLGPVLVVDNEKEKV